MNPGSYYVYGISDNSNGSGATHTWTGDGTNDLASNPDNWSNDSVPQNGDDVIFDGTSIKDCNWNFDISIHSLRLNLGYSGTVTLYSSLSIYVDSTISDGTLIIDDLVVHGNGQSAYSPGQITIN